MKLFPAIDIRNGMAVRLTQGDFDRMDIYAQNPAEVAEAFKEKGAVNLHVVNLDGAMDGGLANFDIIKQITAIKGLFTQVGGGVRDEARISRYLELGAGRVILGTAAAENFDFAQEMIKKYGEKIAVGVDARDGKVSVRGWREDMELDSLEFCKRLTEAGLSAIIYTDISRDGAMQGTNIEIYRHLLELGCRGIIASGGISGIQELAALRDMGVSGAILGKSLYIGAIELEEAARICSPKE